MKRQSFASGVVGVVGVCALWAGSLGVGACGASSGGGFTGDDSSSGASSSSSGGTSSGTSSGSSSGGSSSGRSSSSGGSSGSSSGGSSSGSSGSSSGTSSGLDATIDVAPPPPYDGGPQQCGTGLCSLKTSTCCVDQLGNGSCIPHGQQCKALNAAISCLGAVDCSSAGMVCCGVATTTSADTACQTVGQGGSCAPAMATMTMGSAQVCVTSDECTMGQECIAQTCLLGSHFSLCGLHNSEPFNCTAD